MTLVGSGWTAVAVATNQGQLSFPLQTLVTTQGSTNVLCVGDVAGNGNTDFGTVDHHGTALCCFVLLCVALCCVVLQPCMGTSRHGFVVLLLQ